MIRQAAAAATALIVGVSVSLSACSQTVPRHSPTQPSISIAATPVASGPAPATAGAGESAAFAVIGDYGSGDENEAAVARLVASWDPAYVIAVGDDYYKSAGGKKTVKYDESTGAYYCRWLADVTTIGTRCPSGLASVNAFFPAMGNHDYSEATPAPDTYLSYFRLPGAAFTNTSGNERYYDFVQGPIHFFVLNSNQEEPDGTSSSGVCGSHRTVTKSGRISRRERGSIVQIQEIHAGIPR